MTMTTYKMNKTLKAAATGGDVSAVDFVKAVNEKAIRKVRKNKGYQSTLKTKIKEIREEKERNVTYRDILERKVKFCPKCGYSTIVENHAHNCFRKCKSCTWKSTSWKQNITAFSF